MRCSIKLLMLVLISCSFVGKSFANDHVLGEDYWPFPWGTECPFPWSSLSGTPWGFELNEEKVKVSFHVGDKIEGAINVVTVVYNQDLDLLAYGEAHYRADAKIISLKLRHYKTKNHFNILLRMYSKENISQQNSEFQGINAKQRNRSCSNTKSHVMALTVTSSCSHPTCAGKQLKHQIIDHVAP